MSDAPAAILVRINKLLAMKEARGASEAEASIAAAKVQELMQEYGLSLAEVEAAGGKADDGGREKRTVRRGAMYAWQKALMRVIAEGNFCMHRIHTEYDADTGRTARRHQLIGRRVNVEATQLVYDYLITTMKRCVSEAGYAPGTHNEQGYHCWLEGCSERLVERLEEKAEEARRASERKAKAAQGNGTGRELILSDVYGSENDLNNDTLNGFAPGTTAAKRREREEKQARIDALQAELIANGMERVEAYYVANGYGTEEAKMWAASYHKKPARRSRRGGSSRGWRGGQWTASDARKAERRDSEAFRAGAAKGEAISLNPQAGHSKKKMLEDKS